MPKPGEERYFYDQIAELRQQWGLKPFWQGNKPTMAKRVLFKLYVETNYTNAESQQQAATTFLATINELSKRADLLGYEL